MRSEEIAIRSGDLKEPALSVVQRQARDYVVSNGIRTGNEYGAAIADGKIIERFTSNESNGLNIPAFMDTVDFLPELPEWETQYHSITQLHS